MHVPVAPDRQRIDFLIGQSDKQLLTVLETCKGASPEEPNYVLTSLGPIASDGLVPADISDFLSALRVPVNSYEDAARKCGELKRKVSVLKESVREYKKQEKTLQPSLNNELAQELEPQVEVANSLYKLPVPLISDVLKMLRNNYESTQNERCFCAVTLLVTQNLNLFYWTRLRRCFVRNRWFLLMVFR